MNILLQGARGVGKTRLVHRVCSGANVRVGGFVSVKVVDDDGENVGFALKGYSGAPDAKFTLPLCEVDRDSMFLSGRADSRHVDTSVFDNFVPTQSIGDCDMFVLDEIGGLELHSDSFCDYIFSILSSGKPCIGTIKSEQNYNFMQSVLGTKLTPQTVQHFKRRLIADYNCDIVTLTQQNEAEVTQKLCRAVGVFDDSTNLIMWTRGETNRF